MNHKVRHMEFKVGEQFLHKVSPMKGTMRIDKRGNLTPWYNGPIEVLKEVLIRSPSSI